MLAATVPAAQSADDPSAAANSTMRDKALAWLMLNQARGGEWQNVGMQPAITTAMVVQGMAAAGYRGDFFQRGYGWLASRTQESIDAQARLVAISGLHGVDPKPLCARLLARATVSMGWGAGATVSPVELGTGTRVAGDGISFIDTGLAMDALRRGGDCGVNADLSAPTPVIIQNALFYLLNVRTTGGWPYGTAADASEAAAVIPTAYGILALKQFADGLYFSSNSTNTVAVRRNSAVTWLVSQQATSGEIGSFEGASQLATAIALQALEGSGNGAGTAATNARSWLRSKQLGNGSFNNDPLTTGAVLYAFAVNSPLDRFLAADYSGGTLIDANNDGLPDRLLALCNNPANTSLRCYPDSRDGAIPDGTPVIKELLVDTAMASIALGATGGTAPYTWTTTPVAGALPPGVTVSGATLTGTPTVPGTYLAQLRVTDSLGKTGIASVSLSVVTALTPQAAKGTPLRLWSSQQVAFAGIEGSVPAMKLAGGKAPYRWAVAAGALPEGLRLNALSGRLEGKASAAPGLYVFSLQVTDADGRRAQADQTLQVLPAEALHTLIDQVLQTEK